MPRVVARFRRVVAALVCSGCFSDPGPVGEGTETGSESGSTGGPSSTTPGTDPTASSTTSPTSTSTTDGPTSTESDPTSEVTGDACPPSMQCLEAAPPDWVGPFVVAIGNDNAEPACPSEWPERVSVVHDELQAPAASCSCECTPPGSACSASLELYFDNACSLFDLAQPSEGGGCTQTGAADGLVFASAAVNISPPACSESVSAVIPELTWGATGSLCAWSTMPAACDGDGLCMPTTGEACILREGDHACPEGVYAIERTWWTGAMDTRDCSGCTCGPPVGAVCQGSSRLDLFASGDCSGAAIGSLDLGVCGAAATSAQYVPESLGECTLGADSTPVGDAVPVGPVTLCCAE